MYLEENFHMISLLFLFCLIMHAPHIYAVCTIFIITNSIILQIAISVMLSMGGV